MILIKFRDWRPDGTPVLSEIESDENESIRL